RKARREPRTPKDPKISPRRCLNMPRPADRRTSTSWSASTTRIPPRGSYPKKKRIMRPISPNLEGTKGPLMPRSKNREAKAHSAHTFRLRSRYNEAHLYYGEATMKRTLATLITVALLAANPGTYQLAQAAGQAKANLAHEQGLDLNFK